MSPAALETNSSRETVPELSSSIRVRSDMICWSEPELEAVEEQQQLGVIQLVRAILVKMVELGAEWSAKSRPASPESIS